MRVKFLVGSFILFLLFSLIVLSNMTVTTKQGINFKISRIEIPLYLKILNFYDRHFNYMWLANRITGHLKTKEEKEMCWNEIISITQRLQHLQKADHKLLYNKSIAYNRVGKFKESLVAVDESIDLLNKKDADGMWIDAVSGKALRPERYDRKYMDTLFLRGDALFYMKEYNDSIRAFKKLLAYKKKQLRRFHPLEDPLSLGVFPKALMNEAKKEGMTAEQIKEVIKEEINHGKTSKRI